MRKALFALLIVSALTMAACANLSTSGAGPSSAGLGPDRLEVPESTSTLPERIKSGVSWLWSCVVALRAMGVGADSLSELTATITDISRLAHGGDLDAARELFSKAWSMAVALKGGKA
ncbi:hypothetical protein K9F62_03135 [Desulfovibrio sp. JY]|nr:hypothetical protein K9F62_03135 [Desulfovibrio sp. JY]